MTAPDFEDWGKTPRIFRDAIITEKIDGTNGAIIITDDGEVWAQSRSRVLAPDLPDNFGFRAWVTSNADALVATLGPGRHFGEWWGQGIQRGYNQTSKRFSLFNVHRWGEVELGSVPGLDTVPVLSKGVFNTNDIEDCVDFLRRSGSVAAPGFMNAEGVCVYHRAANLTFKALCDSDEIGKGQLAELSRLRVVEAAA